MSDFLTPAWFERLADDAQRAQPDPTLTLTIEQIVDHHPETVNGKDDQPIRWQVQISEGTMVVDPACGRQPDVTIRADYQTAFSIVGGEISAQRAFLDGNLRIGGDLQLLIDQRLSLSHLHPGHT